MELAIYLTAIYVECNLIIRQCALYPKLFRLTLEMHLVPIEVVLIVIDGHVFKCATRKELQCWIISYKIPVTFTQGEDTPHLLILSSSLGLYRAQGPTTFNYYLFKVQFYMSSIDSVKNRPHLASRISEWSPGALCEWVSTESNINTRFTSH